MTYRLNLSFISHYWFSVKLRALDLVNFSDQTVFPTFFLNACRYWAEFWHVSQSSWFTDQVGVSLHLIDFLRNYASIRLVNFTNGTVFQTFFYTLADIVLILWHLSQLPGFLKAVYKDRHISYILNDDQIPSFTSKRVLYLQEYMQPVGDLVLPCNTFRMLIFFKFVKVSSLEKFCQVGPRSLSLLKVNDKIVTYGTFLQNLTVNF